MRGEEKERAGEFGGGGRRGIGEPEMGGEADSKGRTRGTGSAQRQFINRTTPYYERRPPDRGEPFHRSFSSTMLAKNRNGRGGGAHRGPRKQFLPRYTIPRSRIIPSLAISLGKILGGRPKMINAPTTIGAANYTCRDDSLRR